MIAIIPVPSTGIHCQVVHFFLFFLPSDFRAAALDWIAISSCLCFISFISWENDENERDDSPLSASNCSETTLDVSRMSLGSCAAIASDMMRLMSDSAILSPGGDASRGAFSFPFSSDEEEAPRFDISEMDWSPVRENGEMPLKIVREK